MARFPVPVGPHRQDRDCPGSRRACRRSSWAGPDQNHQTSVGRGNLRNSDSANVSALRLEWAPEPGKATSMEVFSLRETVPGEHKTFATSPTTIPENDREA